MLTSLLKAPKKLKRAAKALAEALKSNPSPSPSKRKEKKRARVGPVLAPGAAKENTPSLFHPPLDITPKKLFDNDVRSSEELRASATVTPRTKALVVLRAYKLGYEQGKRKKPNRRRQPLIWLLTNGVI